MRIDLDELRRHGAMKISFDELPEGDKLPGVSLIEAHTDAGAVDESGDVRVSGKVTARAAAECARCLKRVEREVTADFEETLSREVSEDTYALGEHEAVIDDIVLNAIAMELPMRFLCSEDCRGLCPKCGADLNAGSCGCGDEPDETNPFYKLKDMF